jgi:hypothetical protein
MRRQNDKFAPSIFFLEEQLSPLDILINLTYITIVQIPGQTMSGIRRLNPDIVFLDRIVFATSGSSRS